MEIQTASYLLNQAKFAFSNESKKKLLKENRHELCFLGKFLLLPYWDYNPYT